MRKLLDHLRRDTLAPLDTGGSRSIGTRGGGVRRPLLIALTAMSIGLLAVSVCGIALAAKPKPFGFYAGRYATLEIDQTGKKVPSFNGDCTPVKHPSFTFSVTWGIPVNAKGKIKWSRSNAVNTPDGGTLTATSKVTISAQFVSKREIEGTYQLHKGGCKAIKFNAKLE